MSGTFLKFKKYIKMKKKWSKNEDEHFQLFTYAILEAKKLYHMKSQLLPILVLSLIIWLITFSSN